MKRIDVPWGPNALDRAAQALVQHMGEDAGRYWFVLPAKRGVRKFREALARHLPPHREPPRGIGQGAWLDALRPSDLALIDRRDAMHVWADCLRDWSPADLRRALGQERPASDAATAWLALGQRVRDLHAELVQAGWSFAGLAKALPESASRWKLWADLHSRYRARLAEQGWCDGLEARAEAPILPGAHVAFVMVPTATAVERETLRALGDRAVALVLCDEDHAAGFDEQGFLRPEVWASSHLPLERAEWSVVHDPAAQAQAAQECLAAWTQAQPTQPQDVVLAAPDGESKPFLARRLATLPAQLHDAAGVPLGSTRVAELLRATAAVLPAWRYHDVARLLRHADLHAWLLANAGDDEAGGKGPLVAADAYQAQHFPLHLASLHGSSRGKGFEAHWGPLQKALQAQFPPGRQPLTEWAPGLQAWLVEIYGTRRWDESQESERAERMALEACAAALGRWQATAAPWWPEVPAGAACQLLAAELQGQSAQPLPSSEGEGDGVSLELLGWHELLWDDAPDLIMTGFQEGAIPEPVPLDPWLPPAQRRTLGLPDSDQRAARDAYLLHSLLRCRSRVALITGRQTTEGDPLRPSRFAFHRPDDEIVPALRQAFPAEEAVPVGAPSSDELGHQHALPKLAELPVLTRISVTDFKTYLASPYLYYLQRLLRLDTVDDRAREMDGRLFGTLAHTVLERFGKGRARHSTDVSEIEQAVWSELDQEVARRFGDNTLPAVRLQMEGLRRRLGWFAQRQARWAQEGWRIQEVEWPERGTALPHFDGDPPVDLVGTIDRIDLHPTEGYAILDYKTGDKGEKPRQTHGPNKAGEWKDLQLPLYRHIVRELVQDKPVRVGYFTLGKEPEAVDILWGEWSEEELESADERAQEIVHAIQAGALDHKPGARVQDPIFQALTGEALVGVVDDGEEEEGVGPA